ncbi:MAG: PaaI family thioesterase [Nannocystaceae bacterium]
MSEGLRARITAAKQRGEFTALVAEIPYAGFLGVSLRLEHDVLVGEMPFAPRNVGNAALPALHGGTIAALLELTAAFELLLRTEAPVLPKTISSTFEYLRSGKPQTTFAAAEIVRAGRRVAPVRVHAWQEDRARPIAAATIHFLLGAR